MFADRCKTVSILYGKHYNKDNCRFYTLLIVSVDSCRLSFCDNHEKNRDGRVAWRDIVEYHYGYIKDEKKIKKTDKEIKRASYFKEEAGFNYEKYTGKLRTMLHQLNNIAPPLRP